MTLPLEGIRVLDSTYVFALPYCGGLMADLGAEVIKIEGPGRPDISRTGGLAASFPEGDPGEDWWNRSSTYNLMHRGKRSLVLDMTDERGRALFRQLVGVSDVVMENFTPRVMRGWQLDYPNLRKIKPDIVMVSNTGYGHGEGSVFQLPGPGDHPGGYPRPLLDNRLSRRRSLQSRGLFCRFSVHLVRPIRHSGRSSLPKPDWPRPMG